MIIFWSATTQTVVNIIIQKLTLLFHVTMISD